jgi:hypothetical protein
MLQELVAQSELRKNIAVEDRRIRARLACLGASQQVTVIVATTNNKHGEA